MAGITQSAGRAWLVLAAGVALALVAIYPAAPVLGAAPEAAWAEAEEFVRVIDQVRIEHGRAPLVRDSRLDELALIKARDMAENGYFDHVSPVYGTIFDMLEAVGIEYRWAGENIARAGDVETAHEALMQSPDHRANILSAGYTHVGVGVVRDGRRLYIAQIFANPRS